MNAVRVRTTLSGPLGDLPELRRMAGKVVEIIVLEEPAGPAEPVAAPRADPGGGTGAVILRGGYRRPDFLDLASSGTDSIDWDADVDPPQRQGRRVAVRVVPGGPAVTASGRK